MPILKFDIEADYNKVIKLRDEISALEKQLRGFDGSTIQSEMMRVQTQLASARSEFARITASAAKAGAAIERDFAQGFASASKSVQSQAAVIDAIFGRLESTAAKFGVSLSALGLGNRIMQTRGEFQKLEVAFNTMLGSAEKGSALMQQLVQTAAITPFDLKGVAGGAKQLLAYGIAADEVNDTITKLGDIAAGLSIPLGDLIYLYGTTITQGRMFTQDLRQFQGRGVPIADALAKQMGIAKNAVGDAVTAGKVDAETFKKAILSLASSGSQFGGLMETQSKTITGQISNIKDALDMMFNDMGKSSEGFINTGLSAVSALIENYERVGKALLVVATAFGTYKASLIATQAIEKIKNNSAISGLEAEITKVNEEIAARERLNSTISNKPADGKVSVSSTSNESQGQTGELQSKLSERQAILQAIKQEEAVEKQAKLNIAATEHNAAQSQLVIAQEKQKMAQSSLAIAQQEYASAERRLAVANQEVTAKERELLIAQRIGDKSGIQDAQIALKNANSERDNALSGYKSASSSLSAATEAERTASAQAQTAVLSEQTAAENMHNAAVEKANALNSLNAGETDKATIAARKEVVEIEAKAAALEAEIQRKRELLSLDTKDSQQTDTNPLVADAQTKLSGLETDNASLDAEFQKRVENAQQEVTLAQEKYDIAQRELAAAQDADAKAQDNVIKLQRQKELADEKVQSAIDYKNVLAATDDYEGKEQDQYAADIELNNALCEQIEAGNELQAASEEAVTAAKQANTAAQAANTAETQLNTAQANLNTASQRQQAASEVQATVATKAKTTAEVADTTAITSNSLATKISMATSKAWVGVQTLFTGAIKATTSAFNGLKLAIATNPFGMLITGITTVLSMLPLLSDLLGLNEEEVSESSERFGEAADKTISNVNTLYEVINHSSSESKVYKDAMSELTSVCEQYGIQIDKEGNLLDQLNEKRKELVALIQEEGAARIYANSVAETEQKYSNAIDTAQTGITEEIDIDNEAMASKYAAIITQSAVANMDALKEAYNKMHELSEQGLGGTQEGKAATAEYLEIYEKTIDAAKRAAQANGENEDAINSIDTAANKYIGDMIRANNERDNEIDTLNKAKEETSGLIEATSRLAGEQKRVRTQAYLANLKVDDLKTSVQQVLNECANKHYLEIEISLNDTAVPSWMKDQLGLNKKGGPTKKDVDTAKNRASYWTSQLKDMEDKGVSARVFNGKKYTKEEVAQRAAQYTNAASEGQAAYDKNEADKANAKDKKKNKKTGKSQAEIEAEKNKKIDEINRSWSEQQEKNAEERWNAITQAEIDAMNEGTEKTIAQLTLDYAKELESLEDKEDQLLKAKQKKAKDLWLASDSNNKNKIFENTDEYKNITLTDDERSGVEAQRKSAEIKYNKSVQDVYKQEADAMREYLKEYGTYQQQKLAITEEYAEKIRKAQESGSKGDELTAIAERNKALQNIEISAIKQSVDWGSVFGDFGTMFKDQLQPTIDKLRAIAESDEFKSSSLEDQKTLYELIQKLEQSNAAWDGDIFKKVSDDLTAYQDAMKAYADAQERERIATENLANAKNRLKEAESNSTDPETDINIDIAKKAVEKAQAEYDNATSDVKNFSSQIEKTTNDLQSSSDKARSMFSELESGLSGLASGSLSGVGNGLMQLDKLFSKGAITEDVGNALMKGITSLFGKDSSVSKTLTEALGSTGMTGEIISAALGIMDILKDGVANLVSNLIDTVLGAVNGLLKSALDIKGNVLTIGNALGSGLFSIADTLTFGGMSSWFGGADYSDMNTALSNSQSQIELWTEALNDSMEDIKSNTGNLFDNIEKAEKSLNNTDKEYRLQANTVFGSGASTGSSSIAARYNNGSYGNWLGQMPAMKQGLIKAGLADSSLKLDVIQDLANLSSEQLEWIKENYAELWASHDENVRKALEGIIDMQDEWEKYTEAVNESFTHISFDSFRDNFISVLKDMDNGVAELGDSIEDTIWNALLNNMVLDGFNDRIQDMYDLIEEYNKKRREYADQGTEMSDEENAQYVERIRSFGEDLSNDMVTARDELAAAYGYTGNTSQSATGNAATEITQDQADELNGRMTALQYSAEVQSTALTLANAKLDTVIVQQSTGNNIADGIRDILANSYLELQQINENTEAIVKPIKNMSDKIDLIQGKIKTL